jgi:hypothetical protein
VRAPRHPSRPFATLPGQRSARRFWPADSSTFNGSTRVFSTFVKVTAPAYTSDRRQALVYVQVTCAGRCGGYSLLLLERRDQRWIVVRPLATGIG